MLKGFRQVMILCGFIRKSGTYHITHKKLINHYQSSFKKFFKPHFRSYLWSCCLLRQPHCILKLHACAHFFAYCRRQHLIMSSLCPYQMTLLTLNCLLKQGSHLCTFNLCYVFFLSQLFYFLVLVCYNSSIQHL